jgi:transposase
MSMSNTEKAVKDIRRKTRRKHSTEEKIRIVLEGLRGEMSIAELCRREGINSNLYYRWSKDFLEAGKRRLAGDTVREANTDEVSGLKQENKDLKQAVAKLYLRNDWLKKSLTGQGVILDDGCGRPTLPTSVSWVGVGTSCPRSWTTIPATSSAGG